jgi:peptidoglycan/LPS O-acetylase OafA/YrhL
MVAVIAVVAHHLAGWPRGGFVGVDIFFVIAGFFVTENLLRAAVDDGTPSLGTFYWNRFRRIVPAAVVVLLLTFAASLDVLPAAAAHNTGIDAVFAVLFVANWHFAAGTVDPSPAIDAASPLLHYWPLSVEEQFLLIWPLLILGLTLLAVRGAWSHARWLAITAAVTGLIAATSLGWAIYQSATSPTFAFFSTLTRVWEFGVGALVATGVGLLARMPDPIRPILSWLGLSLIGAGFVLIDGAAGFPAPSALLPVAGAALVIAAGVGREPDLQGFLRNRVSTYLGDISYSLYLVHWPVIVLLAAVMAPDRYFYATAVPLTFGLALALHHFVENPLRYASRAAFTQARQDMRHGLFRPELSTKVAGVAALVLITCSVIGYAMSPEAVERVSTTTTTVSP